MGYSTSLTSNSFQGLGFDAVTGSFLSKETIRVKPDVDYSDFENFVTFSSAVRKVQSSLTFIADNYPVGKTSGFYGTLDFELNQNVITEIDNFNTSATDYELHLVKLLGDPDEIGHPTITATITANQMLSTSATYPVISISRNEEDQFDNSDQTAVIRDLLRTASAYDTGRYTKKTRAEAGTASIANIGSQTFKSTTSVSVNREMMLTNLLPTTFFKDDEHDALPRLAQVIGETLDGLKTYIDTLPRVVQHGYNNTGMPRGAGQSLMTQMLGFTLIDENLRQDLEKQFVRSSITSDTSILDVVEELQERVSNNLQYMYKCKGTTHALEALVSSYGIPSNLINVKEYADQHDTSYLEKKTLVDNYVLDYTNNSVRGDRLVAQGGVPKQFGWKSGDYTIEIGLSFQNSSLPTTKYQPAFHMTDKALNNEIKLLVGSAGLSAVVNYNGQQIELETPAGKKNNLRHALTSHFIHASICGSANNQLGLIVNYPETISGRLVNQTVSALSAMPNAQMTFNPNGNAVCLLGGEANNSIDFRTPIQPDDIQSSTLYKGQLREFRIYNRALLIEDLTAHATSVNNFSMANTFASDPLFSGPAGKLFKAGTISDHLLYRFPLKDNLEQIISNSAATAHTAYALNATQTVTSEAMHTLSITGPSTSIYRFERAQMDTQRFNKSGLIAGVKRSHGGSDVANDTRVLDSNLLSIVASPIDSINSNVVSTFGRFDEGKIYGTASGLYDSTTNVEENEYATTWINTWLSTGDSNFRANNLMFDGINNYQSALENLQDVLLSVLDSAKQLIPAHSHYFEKGFLIAPHLLNTSKIERKQPTLTAVEVHGNISKEENSITAQKNGLLYNDTSYQYDERTQSTLKVKDSALGLCTKMGEGFSSSLAQSRSFGRTQNPIRFEPAFPDQTNLLFTMDRTILSPTGRAAFSQGKIQVLCKGRRIRTTENVVRINPPVFSFGDAFGRSQLITTVGDVVLPRTASSFDAPVPNEDGLKIQVSPSPEFISYVINTLQSEEEPVSEVDIEFSVTNLLNDETTVQVLTFSAGV